MNPNMSKLSSEFSSKRHFHWTKKVATEDEPNKTFNNEQDKKQTFTKSSSQNQNQNHQQAVAANTPKKKLSAAVAVARLRSILSTLHKNRSISSQHSLGSRVIGTLFGYRHGHVHFAFQKDPNSPPAFLVKLATPISSLVKEMVSGLVRIALECDKEKESARLLLEEPTWRTYCNGKKCGFAVRKECGDKEWKVLKAVEPISMGAGVIPDNGDGDGEGEVMYMRAKFERIIGSRDSEAFYMMNPDSNGAPELSVYLLRV